MYQERNIDMKKTYKLGCPEREFVLKELKTNLFPEAYEISETDHSPFAMVIVFHKENSDKKKYEVTFEDGVTMGPSENLDALLNSAVSYLDTTIKNKRLFLDSRLVNFL